MTVKINGSEWTVLWVKKGSNKLFCDNTRCLGVTYFDEKRIYLDKGLSKGEFRKTVIHELVHAFLYEYDIDLEKAGDKVEETVCGFVEERYKKILKLTEKILKAWKMDAMIKTFL